MTRYSQTRCFRTTSPGKRAYAAEAHQILLRLPDPLPLGGASPLQRLRNRCGQREQATLANGGPLSTAGAIFCPRAARCAAGGSPRSRAWRPPRQRGSFATGSRRRTPQRPPRTMSGAFSGASPSPRGRQPRAADEPGKIARSMSPPQRFLGLGRLVSGGIGPLSVPAR